MNINKTSNDNLEENNELISVAFEIILSAGDAKLYIEKALECAAALEFDSCEKNIKEAEANIVKAHQAQTDVIQKETGGHEYRLCLLFVHAQDTLMTTMSELKMAKKFIALAQNLEKRLKSKQNEGN